MIICFEKRGKATFIDIFICLPNPSFIDDELINQFDSPVPAPEAVALAKTRKGRNQLRVATQNSLQSCAINLSPLTFSTQSVGKLGTELYRKPFPVTAASR